MNLPSQLYYETAPLVRILETLSQIKPATQPLVPREQTRAHCLLRPEHLRFFCQKSAGIRGGRNGKAMLGPAGPNQAILCCILYASVDSVVVFALFFEGHGPNP